MKKLVKVEEVEGEGLMALMGQRITLMCMNYFYTGELVGVNETCVMLKNPSVVYETGAYTEPEWADAQKLPSDEYYVMINSIESFGVIK